MSRCCVSALAMLAPVLLILAAPPPGAGHQRTYRFLRAQVFGVGRRRHAEQAHRPDPAPRPLPPGPGTPRPVLYRTRGRVTCGAIDGRPPPPAGRRPAARVRHAVLRGPGAGAQRRPRLPRRLRAWTMHQAARARPTRARDLARRGRTPRGWSARPGEYVEWSAATGFAKPARTSYRYDSGDARRLVVDDAGTVTVIGPEPSAAETARSASTPATWPARSTHTTSPARPRLHRGRVRERRRAHRPRRRLRARHSVHPARASVGAPWAVTKVAPVDAPGTGAVRLLAQADHDVLPLLLGAGHADRRHRQPGPAPDPDPALRRGDPDVGSADPGLRVRPPLPGRLPRPPETPALYVAELRCGRSRVVLVSPDAVTWTVRVARSSDSSAL